MQKSRNAGFVDWRQGLRSGTAASQLPKAGLASGASPSADMVARGEPEVASGNPGIDPTQGHQDQVKPSNQRQPTQSDGPVEMGGQDEEHERQERNPKEDCRDEEGVRCPDAAAAATTASRSGGCSSSRCVVDSSHLEMGREGCEGKDRDSQDDDEDSKDDEDDSQDIGKAGFEDKLNYDSDEKNEGADASELIALDKLPKP